MNITDKDMEAIKFKEIIGKVIIKIENNKDELLFKFQDGTTYKMYHKQDCCESVYIEDINGDFEDLYNTPLFVAEERCEPGEALDNYSHVTWTFYEFATIKGSVNIRWHGESSGYYSELVDFEKIN